MDRRNTYPRLDVNVSFAWVDDFAALAQHGSTKAAFGTKSGILTHLEVPALIFGPGSMAEQEHEADEFVDMQQRVVCDDLLNRLALSAC